MYSDVVEKVQENLFQAEPDAAAFAAMIVDYPLFSEAVCAVSGIQSERLCALAKGEHFTISEFLALHSAADFLLKNTTQDGSDLLSRFPQGIKIAQALQERFSDSAGVEEWLSEAFAYAARPYAFCDNLLKASGQGNLDAFLSDYHFFLDASALCSGNMPDFLAQLLPVTKCLENARRITIPYAVVASLEELSDVPELDAFSGARDGLARIKKIQDAGLLSVRGDKGDTTVIATFLSAFSRFKPTNHMVLLTQDEVLAKAVSLLNHSGLEGDDILIASIGEGGIPVLWFEVKDNVESQGKQMLPSTDGADVSPDLEADDMKTDDADMGWLWGELDAESDDGKREAGTQNAPFSVTSEDESHADDSWGELE